MSKQAAFGTSLAYGVAQVETSTIVGTITGDGDARTILTCDGMTGNPITTDVAVLTGDTPQAVAVKIAAALNLIANITAKFAITSAGATVICTRLAAAANDATMNLDVNNESCTGLTDAPTSANTRAGAASGVIANVSSIGGPGLALDTEDVTTHDSTSGWEEVVGTILRTGEISLEIVYDPAAATANATTGLVYLEKERIYAFFVLTFPDTTAWSFRGYVTGFEPSMPVDGALTASVSIKISGVPTLA